MNEEKSSSVPRFAGPVLFVLVAAVLFVVLRPKPSDSTAASGSTLWDRKIVVLGDPGTSFRYWLHRQGASEFADRDTPAIVDVPGGVLSVEIRHTASAGSLDLKVQNQKGETATTSLSKSNDYADLIITETAVLWSKDHQTVSQLKR